LEKLHKNAVNGVLTTLAGATFTIIGVTSYKDAMKFDKNASDYQTYRPYYENKTKLGKYMMVGGGVLAAFGGCITINAYRKIKFNLVYKEICLSLR
jgi:hypothetical protein